MLVCIGGKGGAGLILEILVLICRNGLSWASKFLAWSGCSGPVYVTYDFSSFKEATNCSYFHISSMMFQLLLLDYDAELVVRCWMHCIDLEITHYILSIFSH